MHFFLIWQQCLCLFYLSYIREFYSSNNCSLRVCYSLKKLDKYCTHFHHMIFKLFEMVMICDMKIVMFLDMTTCNLMDRYSNEILRLLHTCNVTAYRNAVMLQVTDTIWSYDLNFHPMPHGVTVSYKRYTMGFPVCYGSQKHHECTEGDRS
jgi:hypothetical protein